jgi:4-amino-4-deoxy-L-arabinose transferase-like glycosyltransferase
VVNQRSTRWPLWLAIGTAFLLRLTISVPWSGRAPEDPDNYLPLARSLASGRGLARPDGQPTAYRPPLYPVMLVPLTLFPLGTLPWGVALLHATLGAGTVGLTWRAASRWGLSSARAEVASAIVALDPVLVARSGSVMTETLAAFLLTGALASLADARGPSRRDSLWAGLWFGLAALCRPSTLVVALAVGAACLWRSPAPGRWRFGWMALIVFATLLPWAVRNALIFGEPVWTTTHGGHTLALANNPTYYHEVLDGPTDAVWSGPGQRVWFEKITLETVGMTEPEADRFLRREALRLARERPGDFLRASAKRLGRFCGVAPSSAVYGRTTRLATAAWTVPLWLAVVVALVNRETWRWPPIAAVAAVLALSMVHAFYWTDMRMRAPIVPALALLAARAVLPLKGVPRAADGPARGDPGP